MFLFMEKQNVLENTRSIIKTNHRDNILETEMFLCTIGCKCQAKTHFMYIYLTRN